MCVYTVKYCLISIVVLFSWTSSAQKLSDFSQEQLDSMAYVRVPVRLFRTETKVDSSKSRIYPEYTDVSLILYDTNKYIIKSYEKSGCTIAVSELSAGVFVEDELIFSLQDKIGETVELRKIENGIIAANAFGLNGLMKEDPFVKSVDLIDILFRK